MSPLPSASAALTAFLRGVERRGAVLAELQAGDAIAGDAALAAAMRRFRSEAAAAAMSDWPQRFWSLLLAQPQLRTRTPVALPLDATDRLAELGAGPRAALLLRLAAGLDEATAAAALGIAAPSYRLALQRALPHHADGSADPQAWQRLREQIHHRIKTLAPERLRRLADAREAALGDPPGRPGPTAAATATARPSGSRGGLRALWLLLALCAAALTATFWPGALEWLDRDGAPPVPARALPDEAPASRYGAVAGLIAHRDFAVLADPQAALADDLAFHSWLAAQDAGSVPPNRGAQPLPADATASAAATLGSSDLGPEGETERVSESAHAPQ